MRSRLILFGLLLAVASAFAGETATSAQSPAPAASSTSESAEPDEENTRGAFMTSRPKTVEKPAKSTGSAANSPQPRSRRRPKPQTSGTSSGTAKGNSTPSTAVDSKKNPIVQKMGLGVTLFMRDANGLAVRVDPTHEFHKGDAVRVLLETNADGHLYIFNTTDDGPPVMIYPDPELDAAGNFLQAHVPLEIPSSTAAEENLKWFRFDEHPGIERLYFVFTREPLAGVPIEDDLAKFCAEKKNCNWHPEPALWTSLQKEMSTPTPVSKSEKYGRAQTSAEHEAVTRSIGLSREDPEPSLVMMNASTATALLVAAVDLFHR
jgi:hypothetical protein